MRECEKDSLQWTYLEVLQLQRDACCCEAGASFVARVLFFRAGVSLFSAFLFSVSRALAGAGFLATAGACFCGAVARRSLCGG